MQRLWHNFLAWWNKPRLLDQFFESINEDILELTPDMIYRSDPFGRFKRKLDASKG